MSSESPKTLEQLFEFYYIYVKPLYSRVQAQNELPFEVLFEINAAFDHISRHWYYDEPLEQAIDKAYGHLKRSCLDIFKLRLKEAIKQFNELSRIDTSIIDEGRFDAELVQLYTEIRELATEARLREGEYRSVGEEENAFELWQPVLDKCITLEQDFFANPKVNWAKNRESNFTQKQFFLSIVASFITGLVLAFIFWLF